MKTRTKKVTDLPEVTVQEVVHRLRFWMAQNAIPGADDIELKFTLPDRRAQLAFYGAIIRELGHLRCEEAQPMQTPAGHFTMKLEGVTLLVTSRQPPFGGMFGK